MVKVIFEDIERSYYDNSKKELHLRRNLLTNSKEYEDKFAKILEHEIAHIVLQKTWLNILYEYKSIIEWIIFLTAIGLFLFFMQKYLIYQQLLTCIKILNSSSYHDIFNTSFNIT
jgi:hypothetical protein